MTMREDIPRMKSVCEQRGTPCSMIMSDAEFYSRECTVSNLGTPSFAKLSKTGLINGILDRTLFEELLLKLRNGGVSDRGTVQIYAGYSTLNQKLDEIHSVTAPQIIATTNTRYVEKMVDCTALIQVFGTVHKLLAAVAME